MAQLPTVRVNKAHPFENSGVDLAGPFHIKSSSLRKADIVKVWVVTFVCMLTKALHLELVTSLDAEHFLAAFDRFTSRRGVPTEIWSDNGKNFVATNRMLMEAWMKITNDCASRLALQEIKWIFIPRYSPSFGGLWEASVKSIKYFTKRMGDIKNLTFEEFSTLLCKIEALLNSRPITENSINPLEDTPLTPFHFLIHRGITTTSITALGADASPLKKKWLEILKIQTHLWNRFQSEYLHQLQKKSKWINKDRELQEGELVLIDDHNCAPGEWKKGRVVKLYPDLQGVSRKADIKNSEGKVITESIRNLIPLNCLDIEEPSTPTLRCSSRKKHISTTQVLITWLTLTSAANAFNYTILSPGIHIVKLNEAYVKATDINLIIETQLNLTQDLSVTKEMVTEMKIFCGDLKNMPNLESYCWNVSKIVETYALQAATEMMNIYGLHNRQKRWLSGLLTGAKGLAKYSPWIIAAGGMAYQEYEINNLKNQNDVIKERVRKASMLLLNITELEHNEIDQKLTSVIKTQQEENIKMQINSYMDISSLLIATIMERQSSIVHLRPYKELENQYNDIKKKLPNVIVPPVDDIFSISRKEIIYYHTEKVQVKFQIPLINKEPVIRYGIINIPDERGYILDVHNTHYLEVILKEDNSSYYLSTSDDKIAENIYNINQWQNTSDCCLSVLFHRDSSIDLCNNKFLPITSNRIIPVGQNLILTLAIQNVTVICDDKQTSFNDLASIIYLSNCLVLVGSESSNNITHQVEVLEPRLPMVKAPPSLRIATLKPHDAELNHLKKQLEKVINEDSQAYETNTWSINSYSTIFIIFVLLLIFLITVSAIIYYRRRKTLKTKRQNTIWKGPEAKEYHMVPRSTFFLEVVSAATQHNYPVTET